MTPHGIRSYSYEDSHPEQSYGSNVTSQGMTNSSGAPTNSYAGNQGNFGSTGTVAQALQSRNGATPLQDNSDWTTTTPPVVPAVPAYVHPYVPTTVAPVPPTLRPTGVRPAVWTSSIWDGRPGAGLSAPGWNGTGGRPSIPGYGTQGHLNYHDFMMNYNNPSYGYNPGGDGVYGTPNQFGASNATNLNPSPGSTQYKGW